MRYFLQFTFLVLFILFSHLSSAQNGTLEDDFETRINNNSADIDRAMQDISQHFTGFSQIELDNIRHYINRVFNMLSSDSELTFPDMTNKVHTIGRIEIDFGENGDYFIVYSGLDRIDFSFFSLSGRGYTLHSPDLLANTWNLVAVIRFNQLAPSISESMYFIITDMDRL